MKTPSKRDIILVIVIAVCFTLIGAGIAFLLSPKPIPVDNSLAIKNDSLTRIINGKNLIIANKDSLIISQSLRLELRDSLYIAKHIHDKDEIKYIHSLDSIGVSNRLDSVLRGAKLR